MRFLTLLLAIALASVMTFNIWRLKCGESRIQQAISNAGCPMIVGLPEGTVSGIPSSTLPDIAGCQYTFAVGTGSNPTGLMTLNSAVSNLGTLTEISYNGYPVAIRRTMTIGGTEIFVVVIHLDFTTPELTEFTSERTLERDLSS